MDNEVEAATMKAVDSSLAVITVHVTILCLLAITIILSVLFASVEASCDDWRHRLLRLIQV